jgi:uncharacterized DUF497 family protein
LTFRNFTYIHNNLILEWDKAQNASNKLKYGLDFAAASGFSWHKAAISERSREDDRERRFAAIGPMNEKLHTIIFTKRGSHVRIISFRRSNKAEEKAYAQSDASSPS